MRSKNSGQSAPKQRKIHLSQEQKCEIKEAFDLFNTSSESEIDVKDVRVALRALGFKLKRDEVDRMLKERFENATTLDLKSFTDLVKPLMAERNPKEEIMLAFVYMAKLLPRKDQNDKTKQENPLLEKDEETGKLMPFDYVSAFFDTFRRPRLRFARSLWKTRKTR